MEAVLSVPGPLSGKCNFSVQNTLICLLIITSASCLCINMKRQGHVKAGKQTLLKLSLCRSFTKGFSFLLKDRIFEGMFSFTLSCPQISTQNAVMKYSFRSARHWFWTLSVLRLCRNNQEYFKDLMLSVQLLLSRNGRSINWDTQRGSRIGEEFLCHPCSLFAIRNWDSV